MNRRKMLKLGLAAAAVPATAAAQATYKFRDEFASHWKLSREYSLEFAEKMPAEHYGFKPTPEIRSFAEQMVHIGGAIFRYSATMKGEKPPVAPPKEPTKEAVLKYLNEAYDYASGVLKETSDAVADEKLKMFGTEITKRELFIRALDHSTHHRGQTVIYLRLKGLVPPLYRE